MQVCSIRGTRATKGLKNLATNSHLGPMIKMSSDQNQLAEELPGQAEGEWARRERAREHVARQRDSVEGENDAAEPDEIAEIPGAEPVAVRETGRLYRLKG